MRIGITFNLLPAVRSDDGPDDRYEEFDRPETIAAIAGAIRGLGHEVILLGDGPEMLRRLLDNPPDFVFNMAEGEGVGRCREARVPAVLEMLGILYSGSDPLTLAAALDKGIARSLVEQIHPTVAVPRGLSVPIGFPSTRLADHIRRHFHELYADVALPSLILKPAFEGSSKGIRGRCVVDDAEGMVAVHERLSEGYTQPILIEEFIDGEEVTVGLIGNGDRARVLGLMRVVPKQSDGPFVYSLEVKRDWANLVTYETPAKFPEVVDSNLRGAALRVYDTLGCRDVARIDFRVRAGVPYFLEINPLPGLAPTTSDLVILAEGCGLGHAELIGRILNAALERTGLRPVDMAGL